MPTTEDDKAMTSTTTPITWCPIKLKHRKEDKKQTETSSDQPQKVERATTKDKSFSSSSASSSGWSSEETKEYVYVTSLSNLSGEDQKRQKRKQRHPQKRTRKKKPLLISEKKKQRRKKLTKKRKTKKQSTRTILKPESVSATKKVWKSTKPKCSICGHTEDEKRAGQKAPASSTCTSTSTTCDVVPRQRPHHSKRVCCSATTSTPKNKHHHKHEETNKQEVATGFASLLQNSESLGGLFLFLFGYWALEKYNNTALLSNLLWQTSKHQHHHHHERLSYFLRPLQYASYTLFPSNPKHRQRHPEQHHQPLQVTMLQSGTDQGIELSIQVVSLSSKRVVLKRRLSNGAEQVLVVRTSKNTHHGQDGPSTSSKSSSRSSSSSSSSASVSPYLEFIDYNGDDDAECSWTVDVPETGGFFDPKAQHCFDLERVAVRLSFAQTWWIALRLNSNRLPEFALIPWKQLSLQHEFATLFVLEPSSSSKEQHPTRASLSEKVVFAIQNQLSHCTNL